jgi:hypothetical protein
MGRSRLSPCEMSHPKSANGFEGALPRRQVVINTHPNRQVPEASSRRKVSAVSVSLRARRSR